MNEQRRRDISGETKPPNKPVRVFARDRRLAAIHEAGHVVIANMLSVDVALAYIYEPHNHADPQFQKTWTGRTYYNLKKANPRQRRMIGVAGAVAELCCDGEFVDDDYWTDPNMMSESDWRLTLCRPGAPDEKCCEAIYAVGAVLERGAPLWGDLVMKARDLIVHTQPVA
jgi:hypothetical protein